MKKVTRLMISMILATMVIITGFASDFTVSVYATDDTPGTLEENKNDSDQIDDSDNVLENTDIESSEDYIELDDATAYNGSSPDNPLYALKEGEYVPGELIVSLKRHVDIKSDNADRLFPDVNIIEKKDLTDVSDFLTDEVYKEIMDNNIEIQPWKGMQILLLKLATDSKEDMWHAIKLLEENPNVACVSPNFIAKYDLIPNDPLYGQLWGMKKIQAPQAWKYTTGSSSVMVGVIDTGVNKNHEDLTVNVSTTLGYNFIDSDQNISDIADHGTRVAGIIGAVGNNGIGITGVNWNVTIVPLKTDGANANFISALAYANRFIIKIVNCSMGSDPGPHFFNQNVLNAINGYDGLLVVSAGNQSTNIDTTVRYPSSYNCPNMISVAASNENDELWTGYDASNYGASTVHLAAPGVNILSTASGGGYLADNGTSLAAPYVAGAAALLKAFDPNLDTQTLKAALLQTDYCPGLDGLVATNGRLNIKKAIDYIMDYDIVYDANGGVGAPDCERKAAGKPLTLSFERPTKTGALFLGWSTSQTAISPMYPAGGTFTTDADTTLFAVWNNSASNLAISAGGYHSIAQKKDGTVLTWGRNASGELGDGTTTNRNFPAQIPGFSNIIALSSDPLHAFSSIALKNDGTVWAWGDNSNGQLGDGTTTTRYSPAQITGLGNNNIAVSMDETHGIALKSNGTIWAWGNNTYGQLGDGSFTNRYSPVQIILSNVTAIATGTNFSMALRSDGTVWVWGDNTYGQLGDGTTTLRIMPWQIPNFENVISISAGYYHSVALKDDGTVWSWGSNLLGQLGNGTNGCNAPVQIQSLNNIIAVSVGPLHNLALKNDGTIWSWGSNASGQLGDGTTTTRQTPIQIPSFNNVNSVSAGIYNSMALKNDGSIWTWGSNMEGQLGDGTNTKRLSPVNIVSTYTITYDANGGTDAPSQQTKIQGTSLTLSFVRPTKAGALFLGWSTSSSATTPTYAPGGTFTTDAPTTLFAVWNNNANQLAISAGGYHSIALNKNSTAWSWGRNDYGQLGDGTNTNRKLPAQIPSFTSIVSLSSDPTNGFSSIALKSDGSVWAWGDNTYGQLGDGTTTTRFSPVQITGLGNNNKAVSISESHGAALKSDGSVWIWGSNAYGQLGDGTVTDRLSPVQVPNLSSVVAISTGNTFSMALRSDGTIWAWGDNTYGQIGDGTTIPRLWPVQISGFNDVISISAGYCHSVALKRDGSAWSWGGNLFGQLGNGANSCTSPVQIPSLSNVMAVSAGPFHNLALKNDETVWSWGTNSSGQLGDGTTTTRQTPVQIPNFNNVSSVSAGIYHSMVLKTDGSIWTWGSNMHGQLGDGTSTTRLSPIQVLN